MRRDYEAYAQANGVLPMPEGYDPIQQIQINALLNVYVPRFRVPVLATLVALSVFVVWRRRRRRQAA